MRRLIPLSAVLVLLFGVLYQPSSIAAVDELQIEEIDPSPFTARTRQALADLLRQYDLSPFLYTKQIRIQSRVLPHSHPVLTLNTLYGERPDELLTVFLHEQLHWFVYQRALGAIRDLRQAYPELPAKERATPDSEFSAYQHIIVCWLEVQSLRFYLGAERADDVIAKRPVYRWIYDRVRRDEREIGVILLRHQLVPLHLMVETL